MTTFGTHLSQIWTDTSALLCSTQRRDYDILLVELRDLLLNLTENKETAFRGPGWLCRFVTLKASDDPTLKLISKLRCQMVVGSFLPWGNAALVTFLGGVEAFDLRLRYFILKSKAE